MGENSEETIPILVQGDAEDSGPAAAECDSLETEMAEEGGSGETREEDDEDVHDASDPEDPSQDETLKMGIAEAASATLAHTPQVYEYETPLVQPPKLEVIEEHAILHTTTATQPLLSATTPTVADETVEPSNFLVDPGVGAQFTICPDDCDDFWSDSHPPSRHNSIYNYPLQQANVDSELASYVAKHAPSLASGSISGFPHTVSSANHLSEPMLPKNFTEPHGLGGMWRNMGHFVTRHIFGSTAVTPSDSIQSLEFCNMANAPAAQNFSGSRFSSNRYLRRNLSSRNSVTSDASSMQVGAGIGWQQVIKGRRKRSNRYAPTGPTGQVVSRSKRFLTKGTAGFMNTKGTSAISLNKTESAQALPNPCSECPHCRKFFKMGPHQSSAIPMAMGKSCPCRICIIIQENSPEGPVMLKMQAAERMAPRKEKEPLSRMPSDFGIFCEHCSRSGFVSTDGRCSRFSSKSALSQPLQPKILVDGGGGQVEGKIEPDRSSEDIVMRTGKKSTTDMSQQVQMSQGSLVSNASGPVCRICHGCSDRESEALISPCRCLGTLKFVHQSCLVHWLDIAKRKLRKPPICELCFYKYRRSQRFNFKKCVLPRCSSRDKVYHSIFFLAMFILLLSAVTIIMCFKNEKPLELQNPNDPMDANQILTLIAGVIFFVSFFVIMYVEVKSQITIYKLFVRFCVLNQEWKIEEYSPVRDADFQRKLEKDRNSRMNKKIEEISPLPQEPQPEHV